MQTFNFKMRRIQQIFCKIMGYVTFRWSIAVSIKKTTVNFLLVWLQDVTRVAGFIGLAIALTSQIF